MQTGRPSKSALRVAIRRAAHQLVDRPPVLNDPIAVQLVGQGYARDMERAGHRVARDFRALMAVRSRLVEDELAAAVVRGVRQYVVLGAGLDTFAWRNPHPDLHVFEVDLPATQQWKRGMLGQAGLGAPASLTFVPIDLEQASLSDGLSEAGFDRTRPAFFGWLGVVPYLTPAAFRATLLDIAGLAPGTGVGFDYSLSHEVLGPEHRQTLSALANRLAAKGEPLRLFLTPMRAEEELIAAGFEQIGQWDSERLNAQYFSGRADGLRLHEPGFWMIATAWVGGTNRNLTGA
jgi:methyltransferase (TIGR00027 family)